MWLIGIFFNVPDIRSSVYFPIFQREVTKSKILNMSKQTKIDEDRSSLEIPTNKIQ